MNNNPTASNKKTSKSLMVLLSFLGLYLLSTGSSWALFSFLNQEPGSLFSGNVGDTRSKIDLSLPKTEECPINGQMFTEPERDIWETRRPITAMIENHEDSRPLAGLQKADIVYEAVAEGGVTRHLGIFYCGAAAEDVRIAPIRSARVHFLSWAAEYGENPIFVHVGGANRICADCYRGLKPSSQVAPEVDAVGLLIDLGWRVPGGNDFDTTYDIGYPVLLRDPERLGRPIATEHTMVGSTDAIYNEAIERGFAYENVDGEVWSTKYVPWTFVDESPLSSAKASQIAFDFWGENNAYSVSWKYEAAQNLYIRFNGGTQAKDNITGESFTAKNVVVQFVEERGPVDSEKHMFYKTIGSGDALVFQNGDVVKATWEKESISSRTIFSNTDGTEIAFVRGQTWIEGVPDGNEIAY